jgi:hypothetical protein
VIWGTRTRGGSQFLLKLTVALLGRETQPQSRLNAARREAVAAERTPSLSDYVRMRRAMDYFRYHQIAAVKLEEPGMDHWGRRLAAAFPKAPWLGNHRPIEKIIRSHYNLSWGFPEQKLLERTRATLDFYEDLAAQGRLFVLAIDRPEIFDLSAFAAFIGAPITPEARAIAADWPPVNDLADLRASAGDPLQEVEEPPQLDTLHERYPWVADMEARFDALCEGRKPGGGVLAQARALDRPGGDPT